MQLWLNVLLADALNRLGRLDEAVPRVADADKLLQSPALNTRIKTEMQSRLNAIKWSMASI